MITKRIFNLSLGLIVLLALTVSVTQGNSQDSAPPSVPDTAKMTYNQISQSMGLFIYPSKGQSQSKQKSDEYACYNWAMEQSGIDPLNLPRVEAAPQASGPTGGGLVGGAKGAAAGAAIGAIAGDAGKGAAIGAVAGGLAGRRQGKQAQAEYNEQSQENATAAEEDLKATFVKAFSVCIEGKDYTIK